MNDIATLPWQVYIEAEQSVIGGLLLDNEAFDRVADVLRPGDFYLGSHRLIFQVISDLLASGRTADILTVGERIQSLDERERQGVTLGVLGEYAYNTPSTANVRHYAQIVRDRATLRALFGAARQICADISASNGRDVATLVDEAQARILAAVDSNSRARNDLVGANSMMNDVMSFIDEQHARYLAGEINDVVGIPTGFRDLDKRTTGLQPGQLVIVAARPGMGKTAFALNVAQHAALSVRRSALFFSLEMSTRELGIRMLAAEAGVNSQRLVTGRIYEQEWPRISPAIGRLIEVPLLLCESAGVTAMEVRAMARRAMRERGGLSMIVLDYVQLMLGGDTDANRAAQLSDISRELKLLAKELQVPVMILSQLNREVEKRQNKRPVASDLRDSGALEQDADVILFIYRDEIYNPRTEHAGEAEIIIEKQRNGPRGTIYLRFRADNTRFENMSESEDVPE